ncbi:predicted protein [Aspergillus nidulans FGSC A4]|uniref:Uncharacterized protein n=1 Tax=Emericella nidulans (strain FGSC A4 / ATCC 38163 / CBS 112.46 / NRRL 194 / M139) TaxID=227321 RepID=Q5ARJ2_EMENI|nr:hypothetical protein [Aspergillus nidulans FGSC A4]EAA61921.1 predicted protein [Aspergillus nidulans FGSC A4]CBF82574.1 TPA: hypothetical protein ANIA_09088 [Aspergillus nidulans FGSC A4]|eukprot:XP_682357.1 predicted protein [Aspergillus nidulans FGSC A4]
MYTNLEKNAKVPVCKEALKKLKVEFPNWVVPEGPRDSLVSSGWDWVKLCRYCVHQSLPEPLYTKYVHHKGYRHEVEVGGGAYFAPLKYYAAELQSEQSAAHVALYDLLVREDYGSADTEGPSSLKKSNEAQRGSVDCHSPGPSSKRSFEALLDESAQDYLCSSIGKRAPARKLEDYKHLGRARGHGGKNQSPPTSSQAKPAPGDANLQPLKNCSTRTAVHEACAWNVCNYLIDLVKEDMMLEDNAAKEHETITRWGDTARK